MALQGALSCQHLLRRLLLLLLLHALLLLHCASCGCADLCVRFSLQLLEKAQDVAAGHGQQGAGLHAPA